MRKKQTPQKLEVALLQLKLTEKEVAAYLALLENGASTVQDISRASGVNRVSIYAALDKLKLKGLVAESRKGKKKLFVAEDPQNLEKLVIERQAETKLEMQLLQNTILPMLKMIDISQENKPQIKFFEGREGIEQVFEQYILKHHSVINCGSYETATKVVSERDELAYFQEIKERKIFYRMILEDTPLNHKFAHVAKGIAHTKFLLPEIKISADVVISGAVTALISYDRKTATVIEDASIAQAIKMYLDFMWDRL
ncbi:MAG: helix-turn-helix domain-containing protein [Parcubacteria group bacterium]|jgi:sugar-specific transcriptional regulator TrmB